MNQPPTLSICIVNWNAREMLRELLRSIQATRADLTVETIVVDNASADGSADAVAAEFPGAILVRNTDNRGFSTANNQAAARATGAYLLFLNNDTVVHASSLQTLVAFLASRPDISAVGPRLIGRDGQPQLTGRNLPSRSALLNRILLLRWTGLFKRAFRQYRRAEFDPARSGPIPQLAAAALLVRREQFSRIGGFDEGYPFGMEDVDLCARLASLGPVYYLADATITHLGRISSRSNSPFVYRGYEIGYARYFRKHGRSHIATLIYKLLVTLDLPLRIGAALLQYLANVLRRNPEGAQRSLSDARAGLSFIASLPRLWRA